MLTNRQRTPVLTGGLMRLSVLAFLCASVGVASLTAVGAVTCGGGVGASGVPVGSVEGVVPSLGLGATTRDDGRYGIVIPGARATPGQTLTVVARRLGYKPSTVQVTLRAGIVEQDFTLAPNPLQLGEIVITGAGTVTEAQKLGSVRNAVDSALVAPSNESNTVPALPR